MSNDYLYWCLSYSIFLTSFANSIDTRRLINSWLDRFTLMPSSTRISKLDSVSSWLILLEDVFRFRVVFSSTGSHLALRGLKKEASRTDVKLSSDFDGIM